MGSPGTDVLTPKEEPPGSTLSSHPHNTTMNPGTTIILLPKEFPQESCSTQNQPNLNAILLKQVIMDWRKTWKEKHGELQQQWQGSNATVFV